MLKGAVKKRRAAAIKERGMQRFPHMKPAFKFNFQQQYSTRDFSFVSLSKAVSKKVSYILSTLVLDLRIYPINGLGILLFSMEQTEIL